MKVKIIVQLALLLVPSYLMAQFKISGEIRPRTELRHGYKTLASIDISPAFFTSQRSRINLHYESQLVEYYVCLQDIRVWGDQPQLVRNDGAASSFHEAWGTFELYKEIHLKFGRQEINLDNQRIFGAVDWAQQARSHDAALFYYQNDSSKVEVKFGLAYNQQNQALFGNQYNLMPSYKTFQFIWLNKAFKQLNVSFLFLKLGNDESTNVSYRTVFNQTTGFYVKHKGNALDIEGSGYYQSGNLADGHSRKISAWHYALSLDYRLNSNWGINGGYELLSGTGGTSPSPNYSAFNPYFGTNHKFNGQMDYFYVGNYIGSFGLKNAWLKLYQKGEKASCAVTIHHFQTQVDPFPDVKRNLGMELDLNAGYKLNDFARVDAVYGQIWGTETLELIKNGNRHASNYWAYLMISINPYIFESKNRDY